MEAEEEDEDRARTAKEGRKANMYAGQNVSLAPSLAGSPAGLSTLGLTLIHLGRLS